MRMGRAAGRSTVNALRSAATSPGLDRRPDAPDRRRPRTPDRDTGRPAAQALSVVWAVSGKAPGLVGDDAAPASIHRTPVERPGGELNVSKQEATAS
jgi:hypothetical protein